MNSRQRERCDLMIIQPEWGTRNVNKYFYESEARRIAALNETFGDVELTIEFDRERCVWKFKKAETELWKQPPNPLLEAINNFLTEDKPEWEGTATELVSQLPDMQIQANVLSRKLNVVNSQLLNDYGIFYDNKRGHERKIILKRLEPRE